MEKVGPFNSELPSPLSTFVSDINALNADKSSNSELEREREQRGSKRPFGRTGDSSPFDGEDGIFRPLPVEGKRMVITTEQFVNALIHDKSRADEFFCQDSGCSEVFRSAKDYSAHYVSKHRYKCVTCKKSLPGHHLLELHVLENHDTLFSLMAQRKPMFSCLAEECPKKFQTAEGRYDHLHQDHKKHSKFRTFRHFQLIHSPRQLHPKDGGRNSVKQSNGLKIKLSNSTKHKSKPKVSAPGVVACESSESSGMEIDPKLIPEIIKEQNGQRGSEEEIKMEDSIGVKESGKKCTAAAKSFCEDCSELPKHFFKTRPSKKSDEKFNPKSSNKAIHKNALITFGHHGQKFRCRQWHSQLVGSSNSTTNMVIASTDSMDLSSIQNVLIGHEE